MIVHVIPDSSFLDVVIPLLLEVSQDQIFVVPSDNIEPESNSPATLKRCRDKVHFISTDKIKDFCRSMSRHGCNPFVIFHSLTMRNTPIIKELSNEFTLGWIPWGGCDVYDHLPFDGRLLRTFVNELLKADLHSKCSLILHLIRHGILYRVFPILDPNVRIRRLFRWCFALTEEDYRQYRNKYGVSLFPASFSEFSYVCYDYDSLPSQVQVLDDVQTNHLNIMIGNMGLPKYNHLEVYDFLKRINLQFGGKVYASFGYGEKKYSDYVITQGKKMLGSRFSPITSWMSKDDYFKLISSCGIYIANHIVQGGLGTMQLALMAGCKLYLNDNGATYKIFKEIGFIVFALPKSPGKEFLTQLSLTEKRHNQSLCLDYWGREKVMKRFQRMVEICERETIGDGS